MDSNFPAYLSTLLQIYSPNRLLRSSNDTRIFVIPKVKKNVGNRSFSFSGPEIWNSLPYHVRHSPTSAIFKKNLKTYLFQSSYE